MDEATAAAAGLCALGTAKLITFKENRVASMTLRSGEFVAISLGTATVKVFTPRRVFKYFPKVVVAAPFETWAEDYKHKSTFERRVTKGMVLNGLIVLISRCKSLADVRANWGAICRDPRCNPIAVIAGAVLEVPSAPDDEA